MVKEELSIFLRFELFIFVGGAWIIFYMGGGEELKKIMCDFSLWVRDLVFMTLNDWGAEMGGDNEFSHDHDQGKGIS